MAFFFKSPYTTSESASESDAFDGSSTTERDAGIHLPGTSRCQECGFVFQDERYREDHKRWHEHVRSKKSKLSTAKTSSGNVKESGKNPNILGGIKKEKPDDSDTGADTSCEMTASTEMVLKPFACEYCGWRFILKRDMVHHVRTHTGEKPYACPECDKRFSRAHSLTQHKRVHAKEGKSISCGKCSQRFWTKNQYAAHCKDTHNTQDKLPVNIVKVESTNYVGGRNTEEKEKHKDTLNSIEVSHSAPLPSSIGVERSEDVDGSNVSNTRSLQTDGGGNNTEGSAPLGAPLGGGKRGIRYTCQFCGWGFWDKKDRRQHEWTHTGHKPYLCKICNKTFSRTYTLKLHMRGHTGERPYSCQYCDKTFAGPSSLRLHTKVHTKVQRHRCNMCPMSFKRLTAFRDHQREHLISDPIMFARCYSSKAQLENSPGMPIEGDFEDDFPHPVSLTRAQSTSDLAVSSQDVPGNTADRNSSISLHSQETLSSSGSFTEQQSGPELTQAIFNSLPSTSEELQDKDREALICTYNKLISGPKRKREPRFICQFCDKGFHDKKDCRQHENTHTGFKPYACGVCGKRLSRLYSLKVHMMSHTGSRLYPCRYCCASFRDRNEQKSHELTHADSKSYHCKLCKEIFQQASSFAEHLRLHQSKDPDLKAQLHPDELSPQVTAQNFNQCDESPFDTRLDSSQTREPCSVSSDSAVRLEGKVKQRMAQKSGGVTVQSEANTWQNYRRPLRYNCSYCSQRFRDKKDWRQHENTHTGFKPYPCTICGKKLSRQYSLKKHMLMHSGQKPVACKHCKKTFRDRNGLRSHQRAHHPWVLLHTCCLCKAAHKELEDLENHVRVDHGDVIRAMATTFFGSAEVVSASSHQAPSGIPPSLDQAEGEDVAVRCLLKQDQDIDPTLATAVDDWLRHEGRKMISSRPKFVCHFCGKGFQNRKDWQQHENTHTGYKPYTCDVCGKKLSRLHSLKAHLLTHSAVPPYVCQRCGKGFRKKISLERHEVSQKCTISDPGVKTVTETNKTVEERGEDIKSIDVEYHQVPSGPFFFKLQEPNPVCVKEPLLTGTTRQSISTKTKHSRQHVCTYCGWRFSDFNIFRRHSCRQRRLLRKGGRKRMSCSNCNEIFSTKAKLDFHLETCGYFCRLCSKNFKTEEMLEMHLRSHADAEEKQDPLREEDLSELRPICSTSTLTADSATSRDQELPGNRSVIDNIPAVSGGKTTFGDISPSQKAGNQGSATELESCEKFPAPANTPSRRKSSRRVVATCRLCHKNFFHGYALKLHLMMHASERQYKCKICAKRFSSKKGLKKHTKSHASHSQTSSHNAVEANTPGPPLQVSRDVPSNTSGAMTQEPSKPGSHLESRRSKSQTPQTKPHQCVYCGWSFWTRKDCVIHERTHTGEKPYVCETCGKGFARSYSLKLHSLTHVGMKPFKCSYCNKGFSSGGYVKVHERTHTKEKPYGCRGCGARFSCSSSLTRHEKSCQYGDVENQHGSPISSDVPHPTGVLYSLKSEKLKEKELIKITSDTSHENERTAQGRDRWLSKPGVCFFCGWRFRDIGRMQRHKFWHRKRYFVKFRKMMALYLLKGIEVPPVTGRQPLSCTSCDARFYYPVILKIHLRSHTGEQPYQCTFCSSRFSRYPVLVQHKVKHHDLFVCPYCERFTIKDQRRAWTHRQKCRIRRFLTDDKTNEEKSSYCKQCDRTFRGPNAKRFHASHVHATVDPSSCARCHKAFKSQGRLKRHLLSCSCEGTRVVSHQKLHSRGHPPSGKGPSVDQNLSDRSTTPMHPPKLDDEDTRLVSAKPFPCPYCSSSFAKPHGLKQHVRIHTGEKSFLCHECGKAFTQKIHLTQHMFVHTGEKRFECPLCPKRFSYKHQLARHALTHAEQPRPHGCELCPMKFKTVRELTEHHLVHTGDRPHGCGFCGKGFKRNRDRIIHERIHTGERPFQCGRCGKSFAKSYPLKRHMRFHTGERPYKCGVCSKGFNDVSNLRCHQKKHERQGTCDRCGLIFKSKESLEQHFQSAMCSPVTSKLTENNNNQN